MSDPIVQMVQITLQIDGQETTVPAGTTVLKAAQQLGVSIPTLCHHPQLEDYGGCRLPCRGAGFPRPAQEEGRRAKESGRGPHGENPRCSGALRQAPAGFENRNGKLIQEKPHMPTVFTAREIAESAVEKEMKRRDFYAKR